MSIEITKAFVEQYSNNFLILSQQKLSRLESTVDVDYNIVGASKTVERIGSTEAQSRTGRHSDTKLVNTPHSRRWLDLIDKDWADLVDEADKIRMLADPTSPYLAAGVAALNRAKDDVIIAALGGTARAASDSGGNIALPAAQKIAEGTTGMTLAKLLAAKQMLDEAEVDDGDEDDQRTIVCTAEQIADLLNTTQVTSHDYNTVKALVNGEIDTFLGFKFKRSERLSKTGTARFCYAYTKGGIRLGVGQDIKTRIDPRPDKNYSVQVFASMSLGAVRTEEPCVVEIACKEAA